MEAVIRSRFDEMSIVTRSQL